MIVYIQPCFIDQSRKPHKIKNTTPFRKQNSKKLERKGKTYPNEVEIDVWEMALYKQGKEYGNLVAIQGMFPNS